MKSVVSQCMHLTPLCMQFLSITVLQPIGPYFLVFNIPVIVIAFIKSVYVCTCVYIKTSSHLYRVHLYPVFLSAWSKRLSFLSLCMSHLAPGQKIIWVTVMQMSAWETFYLWINFHLHFVLCEIQQMYSVSSSLSLWLWLIHDERGLQSWWLHVLLLMFSWRTLSAHQVDSQFLAHG